MDNCSQMELTCIQNYDVIDCNNNETVTGSQDSNMEIDSQSFLFNKSNLSKSNLCNSETSLFSEPFDDQDVEPEENLLPDPKSVPPPFICSCTHGDGRLIDALCLESKQLNQVKKLEKITEQPPIKMVKTCNKKIQVTDRFSISPLTRGILRRPLLRLGLMKKRPTPY